MCWPSRFRLMHVPWRFYFSWPNYRRYSQSPSAAKRNSPVGGNKHQTASFMMNRPPLFLPLVTLWTLSCFSSYRGALKDPWAALAATLTAAWRTAWLDMTPVANSAWAFWKLASVCLYRLWTWGQSGQNTLIYDVCRVQHQAHTHIHTHFQISAARLGMALWCKHDRNSWPFPIKCQGNNSVFTFFSRTTPMAAWAVKKMALIIMMAPTATLLFIAARLTIHPLKRRGV